MLERRIEQHLVRRAKEAGGVAWKWVSPGETGVPDRIVILPGGRVIFVECKAPSGRLSVKQQWLHGVLLGLGVEVRVVDSREGVDELFA